MKKIYIHKIHLILCFTSVLCFGLPINAQQNAKNGAADNNLKSATYWVSWDFACKTTKIHFIVHIPCITETS